MKDKDLTAEIIYLENQKKKAAKEMDDQVYHMIWYGKPNGKVDPVSGKPEVVGHIEKRDVNVEEIFIMFPEISPAFFKHFDVNEITFRFKGGTMTLRRKES